MNRVSAAFPEMSPRELREAIAEKFGWPDPEPEPKAPPPKTPDERMKSEAIRKAAPQFAAFFRDNLARFKSAVMMYDDKDAHELLDQLREDFWGDL